MVHSSAALATVGDEQGTGGIGKAESSFTLIHDDNRGPKNRYSIESAEACLFWDEMVARLGIEPRTRGFSVPFYSLQDVHQRSQMLRFMSLLQNE